MMPYQQNKKISFQPKKVTPSASYFFKVLKVLGTVFIWYLTFFAFAKNALANSAEDTGSNNNKIDLLRNVCTNTTYKPINFPEFRAGGKNNNIIPLSCVEDENSDECKKQSARLQNFSYLNEAKLLNQIRQKIMADLRARRVVMEQEIQKLQSGLSREQKSVLNEIKAKAIDFTAYFLSEKHFQTLTGLPCGDHTFRTLRNLLKIKLRENFKVKLQLTVLGGADPVNGFDNHAFVMIDNDGPDVEIVKDRNKVENYLNQYSQGLVCDTWNHGTFVKLSEDKSGLYGVQAGYNSLSTKTISLNFSKLDILPLRIKNYFCNLFRSIDLDLEPRSVCGFFDQHEASDTNEHIKEALLASGQVLN